MQIAGSVASIGREHFNGLGEFSPGIVGPDSTIQWPEVCWPSEEDPYGHRSTGEGRLLVYVAFPNLMASHYWLHSPLSFGQGPLELVSARGPLESRFLENDWASHPGEPWDDWQGGLAASHIFGQTDRSLYSDLRASRERSGYFPVGRENLTEHGGALYDELERYFAVEPTLVTVLQRHRSTQ